MKKIRFYENFWTKYKYQYTPEELNTFIKFAATSIVNELSRLLVFNISSKRLVIIRQSVRLVSSGSRQQYRLNIVG